MIQPSSDVLLKESGHGSNDLVLRLSGSEASLQFVDLGPKEWSVDGGPYKLMPSGGGKVVLFSRSRKTDHVVHIRHARDLKRWRIAGVLPEDFLRYLWRRW
jgi:hypothetical protein